jgi:hypothetical protein
LYALYHKILYCKFLIIKKNQGIFNFLGIFSHSEKYFILFIIKNPHVTQDITLSLPVENIEKSQKDHIFFQFNSLHKLCAQSSITKIFLSFAISIIFLILDGFQKVC